MFDKGRGKTTSPTAKKRKDNKCCWALYCLSWSMNLLKLYLFQKGFGEGPMKTDVGTRSQMLPVSKQQAGVEKED